MRAQTEEAAPEPAGGIGSAAAAAAAAAATASSGDRNGFTTAAATPSGTWTFLTNHAHVLICLARNPEARLRDVADQVGITERAVQRIVAELEEAGVLKRFRDGRRNHYEIHPDIPLRHPLEANHSVRELLDLLLPGAASRARRG